MGVFWPSMRKDVYDYVRSCSCEMGSNPWLDAVEWRQLQQEREENPDKFHQQRESAKKKNESVSSHLGSGGYETLREEFMSP